MSIEILVLCSSLLSLGYIGESGECYMAKHVVDAANKYEINPFLLAGLVTKESMWRENAESKAGACGMTQVMPRFSKFTCSQLKDAKTSAYEGARALSFWLYDYAEGNRIKGLCGYNRGYHCNKRNKGGISYANQVIAFSLEIEERYKELRNEESPFKEGNNW